jgi:acyl-CoA thioesterase
MASYLNEGPVDLEVVQEFLSRASSSSWYKLIGMRPRIVDGDVVIELDLDEAKHLQALGVAHGGVIASVLDSAIALNVNKRLVGTGRVAVTTQLNVHYLRSVCRGRLVGTGRPVYVGSRTAVGYGEARVEGNVVAIATATLAVRELEKGAPA